MAGVCRPVHTLGIRNGISYLNVVGSCGSYMMYGIIPYSEVNLRRRLCKKLRHLWALIGVAILKYGSASAYAF